MLIFIIKLLHTVEQVHQRLQDAVGRGRHLGLGDRLRGQFRSLVFRLSNRKYDILIYL